MQKMCILSNSEKFSAGRLLLPEYDFSATLATTYSTYHLGSVASLKFLAIENMPPHFSAHVYCGQSGGWIRIPLMPRPRQHCVRWVPSSPPHTEAQKPPTFWPTALAPIPAGPHFTHNLYCQLGSAQWAALMAILLDNCHPSSY